MKIKTAAEKYYSVNRELVNTHKEFPKKYNCKTLKIKSQDGLLLAGDLCESSEEKRIILALHGFKSSPEKDFLPVMDFLLDNGSTIVFAHTRGHGKSEGKQITFGIKERHDCFSWVKYICENISGNLPVYIYGVSMGAATALMTSGMKLPKNVKGIIADSAYSSPAAIQKYVCVKKAPNKKLGLQFAEKLDKYLMKTYDFSVYDYTVKEAFKSNSRPILFFHGEKDTAVPLQMCLENYNNCRSKKELIVFDDCDHLEGISKHYEKYTSALLDFFEQNDNMDFKGEVHLNYPEKTMYEMVEEAAQRLPDDYAYDFFGKKTTYKGFIENVNEVARAFATLGVGTGDTVTLCLPNMPQAIESLYALNKIGATASFIHPMSAQKEIEYYLTISPSKIIITPDMFYDTVVKAVEHVEHKPEIIVVRIQDGLSMALKPLYAFAKGKEYLKYPDKRGGISWADFVKRSVTNSKSIKADFNKNRTSVILFSGGTTGNAKGICLSDYNFNALAMQARIAMECEFSRGLKNLSAMPIFHGFGLGIGIHTVLVNNACCVLLPTVTTKLYSLALNKAKPNFIAGVPTIFKMLIQSEDVKDSDLSFLKGMYVGGDSMPVPLKKETDEFLKKHGADIQVREGYGLTECVTASCLTPKDTYKEGSIGLPFPDTLYKIVKPGTDEEMPCDVEGEIVISGPTVMLGYKDNEKETADTLKTHSDGRTWLHTGDLGKIDKDGYIYFNQRAKRMIITSGYNVSPAAVEKAIEEHPAVEYSCVIGIKDEYKIEKIKAFVVLKNGEKESEEMKKSIKEHCKKYIAAYALPREIEFREELPKTLVGKVAYRKLEEEEIHKTA